MSTEAVKQFWQKANSDKALQAKLATIQGKERQAAIAAVVKLAAEVGFVFTAQEYDAAVKEELTRQHSAGELDERQLVDIAGGIGLASPATINSCNNNCPATGVGLGTLRCCLRAERDH
jgi:hypothetical protein